MTFWIANIFDKICEYYKYKRKMNMNKIGSYIYLKSNIILKILYKYFILFIRLQTIKMTVF